MRHPSKHPTRCSSAGFSLVELLVVVGLIGVMVAFSLPNLVGYLRTLKIRGAANQLAEDIAVARGRAIMKNVNVGVVLVPKSATSYRWYLEDSGGLQLQVKAIDADCVTNGPTGALCLQAGPLRELPEGVEFATVTPNSNAIRFTRLGGVCNADRAAPICAPGVDEDAAASSQFLWDPATGATIQLFQSRTGLKMSLTVTPGGRVNVTRGWQ